MCRLCFYTNQRESDGVQQFAFESIPAILNHGAFLRLMRLFKKSDGSASPKFYYKQKTEQWDFINVSEDKRAKVHKIT